MTVKLTVKTKEAEYAVADEFENKSAIWRWINDFERTKREIFGDVIVPWHTVERIIVTESES